MVWICPSVVAVIYCNKQKKLTAQMNKRMEELELDVRKDIRQGPTYTHNQTHTRNQPSPRCCPPPLQDLWICRQKRLI